MAYKRTLYFIILGNKPGSAASRRPAKTTISVNDRVSVYLELAEAHRLLGNQVRLSCALYYLRTASRYFKQFWPENGKTVYH